MPPARVWIEAARPRTLAAGATPVIVGTAASGRLIAWRATAALVVALALQVAVNFANDLFDADRGVDRADRAGPRRAVAARLVSRGEMKGAIAGALGAASVAGLALAAVAHWGLLAVGVCCIGAALGYSGGPRPFGSAALGEAFVFVFFGLVATVGSAYVQIEAVTRPAIAASIPVGLLAAAMLVANNLRDIATDQRAGKRTLAVRLGRARTLSFFRVLIATAFAGVVAVAVVARSAWPLVALAALPAARRPLRRITSSERSGLIDALVTTARLEITAGVLLAAGLWAAR
jgi:1,4-dihydroxy-2-naphthoate octaprenyltransferase